MWVESSDEQPVIIIQQFQPAAAAQLVNLLKPGFTFSHGGWTVGLECRSYNQDTGQIRSKRKSVDR